ncbi:protein of unknown function [Prosthecobacter debontii]|uniref:DUF4266 domain-containing protein n=1 Tax=Prosthecobacter debontii TaxID=48467 RepID=A0A1T4Y5W0_9BACT|nr:DUF4266 domain-containing protein [Prosthecobacter debontii]SKA97159.1 protein of unknown function [Prosthecobacter debontii]
MKLRILFFAISALLLSNCTQKLVRVKPYERGNLAHSVMSPERDGLLTAMTQHAYFSREASFGGGGVGGGGCGCN